MGRRNYLIEGVSGTGKTSVCHELRRRGYAAINGDRDLRYQGHPPSTFSSAEIKHAHNLWDVEKVRRLAANQDDEVTFFCGGSRNFKEFIDIFDEIFILDVDVKTLNERLDNRPDDDWGKSKDERELILRLHATKEDLPGGGIVIDATQPLVSVVDKILRHVQAQSQNFYKGLMVGSSGLFRCEMGKNDAAGEMFARIATFFGVSTDYPLGLSDAPTPIPTGDLAPDEVALIVARRRRDYPTAIRLLVPEESP